MLFVLQSWEWFLGALISGATCNEFEKKRKKTFLFSLEKFHLWLNISPGLFTPKSLKEPPSLVAPCLFCAIGPMCFFFFFIAASFAAVTAPFPRSASSRSSKDIIHNALLRWVGPRVKCLFIGRGAGLCSSVALIISPCRQIYFAALFEIEIKVFGGAGVSFSRACDKFVQPFMHTHRRTHAICHSLLSSPLKLDLMQSAPLFLRSM